MEILKKTLMELEGECVDIHIQHVLFGEQNVKIKKLIPVTDAGVGFRYRNQEVYIPYDQVNGYQIENNKIIIIGHNHTISILKNA